MPNVPAAIITEPGWVCDRCGRPAVQEAGRWVHAELADSVFCDLVMRAPERAAQAANE